MVPSRCADPAGAMVTLGPASTTGGMLIGASAGIAYSRNLPSFSFGSKLLSMPRSARNRLSPVPTVLGANTMPCGLTIDVPGRVTARTNCPTRFRCKSRVLGRPST
jgi:hypothetical protein